MKLGIIIYSSDPETVWNALRLANLSLKQKDHVCIFLMAKGVEIESLDSSKFDIARQLNDVIVNQGEILACGTCLNIRKQESTESCPAAAMQDISDLIKNSDKIISF